MPPQPGLFPLYPPSSSSHAHQQQQQHTHTISSKPRLSDVADSHLGIAYHHHHHQHTHTQHIHPTQHIQAQHTHPHVHPTQHMVSGPSSRGVGVGVGVAGMMLDDGKREKRRRELAGKLGKEMSDRRDDGRHYHETITALHNTAHQLSIRPESLPLYDLRLLPLTYARSAALTEAEQEERRGVEAAQTAYDEERERVEGEWKRGRERVRERLLEGIEERRRRAREEKEGEGTGADATLDASSRPHITRKLRNKLGTSPPPTPLSSLPSSLPGPGLISSLPITTGPFLNPHSLAVDELPSPFPLPLTSTPLLSGGANGGGGGGGGAGGGAGAGAGAGRRRAKGAGGAGQVVGGLGKSLLYLAGSKESEVESDLNEIRRGNKRRRAAAVSLGKMVV